jgi:putative MATE family efflux protein
MARLPGASAGKGTASPRDWTQGSIIRSLWSLSWPAIITQILFVLGVVIDMVFVARLGAAPTAGVGIAGVVVTVVVAGVMGLATGVRAMVARFVGAGDIEKAQHAAQQALLVSAIYGGVFTIIGFFLSRPIMGLFGAQPEVITQGANYLRIWALAWIPLSLYTMNFSIMQASGDTVSPMRIIVLTRVLHVLLDPPLIFGWWIFPRLGVGGAALTSVITLSLAMVLTLVVLSSGRSRLRLTLRRFRVDLDAVRRLSRIGAPASIMGVQRSLSNLVLAWFMVPFGTAAVAAHSLIQRMDLVLMMITTGLGIGSGILIGQYLGANQPEKAQRSGWLALGLGSVIMLVCSSALLIWPERIVGLFTSDPDLVELAGVFLRIAAAGYLIQSFSGVLQGAVSGAGDTMAAMIFSLAMTWAVQLPISFLMTRSAEFGVYGVRWAMVASLVFGALVFVVYFATGRWKHKRV